MGHRRPRAGRATAARRATGRPGAAGGGRLRPRAGYQGAATSARAPSASLRPASRGSSPPSARKTPGRNRGPRGRCAVRARADRRPRAWAGSATGRVPPRAARCLRSCRRGSPDRRAEGAPPAAPRYGDGDGDHSGAAPRDRRAAPRGGPDNATRRPAESRRARRRVRRRNSPSPRRPPRPKAARPRSSDRSSPGSRRNRHGVRELPRTKPGVRRARASAVPRHRRYPRASG